MKQLSIIITILIFCQLAFGQESEIERKLKGVSLQAIQKDRLEAYDFLTKWKNKIVIIEFWETTCGACITQMSHLKVLKDKYPNELNIVCISNQDLKRTIDFTTKNPFPFDFIFDEQKKLSKIFPHSLIPNSVIIDKNGSIQANTHPAFIDEDKIEQLLLAKEIDLPTITQFNPDNLGNGETTPSIVTFELLNHELGELRYSRSSTTKNKKKIITDYGPGAYTDTTEMITEYTASTKTILELYQFAYGNMTESNFIYPNDLKRIKSASPNNLYKLNYKISNMFGDFNEVLIRQLNAAFGFETEKIKIDTTVLVLKKVEVNGHSIKPANQQIERSVDTRISNYSFFEVKGNKIELKELANFIAAKTERPVDIDVDAENLSYELNISMEKPTANLEEWLNYFHKEGLVLT